MGSMFFALLQLGWLHLDSTVEVAVEGWRAENAVTLIQISNEHVPWTDDLLWYPYEGGRVVVFSRVKSRIAVIGNEGEIQQSRMDFGSNYELDSFRVAHDGLIYVFLRSLNHTKIVSFNSDFMVIEEWVLDQRRPGIFSEALVSPDGDYLAGGYATRDEFGDMTRTYGAFDFSGNEIAQVAQVTHGGSFRAQMQRQELLEVSAEWIRARLGPRPRMVFTPGNVLVYGEPFSGLVRAINQDGHGEDLFRFDIQKAIDRKDELDACLNELISRLQNHLVLADQIDSEFRGDLMKMLKTPPAIKFIGLCSLGEELVLVTQSLRDGHQGASFVTRSGRVTRDVMASFPAFVDDRGNQRIQSIGNRPATITRANDGGVLVVSL